MSKICKPRQAFPLVVGEYLRVNLKPDQLWEFSSPLLEGELSDPLNAETVKLRYGGGLILVNLSVDLFKQFFEEVPDVKET